MQAVQVLLDNNVKEDHIIFLNLIGSPEGIDCFIAKYPKVKIVIGELDAGLNEDKYIVPGCGDFGCRYFFNFVLFFNFFFLFQNIDILVLIKEKYSIKQFSPSISSKIPLKQVKEGICYPSSCPFAQIVLIINLKEKHVYCSCFG